MQRSRTKRPRQHAITRRWQARFDLEMRRLLRNRGEWHGTIAQLQRDVFPDIPLTHLGRCAQRFVVSRSNEFAWEKRTLEDWGVVHFFKRIDGSRCRTEACGEDSLARGRCGPCFRYLHRHYRRWPNDAELQRVRHCCFHGCRFEADECWRHDPDFALCASHHRIIGWRMDLEVWLGEYAVDQMPWDIDWMDARYLHILRKGTGPTIRPRYDNVKGDTPLMKIFLHFLGRYEPFLDARIVCRC